MFLDLPQMKFHNLGPVPLKQEGEMYHSKSISLEISADKKSISGKWVQGLNELSLELKPGALPSETAPEVPKVRTAKPAWIFKTGGAIWSSPVTADGVVYFGSSDGMIYALKADSGKQVWQFKTGGAVMGRPTIDAQFVYALSDDGNLYKMNRKSGQVAWRFDTHGENVSRDLPSLKSETYDYLVSSAAIADGVVYIGSADKRLYAVDERTGAEKWHFETKGLVRSTPAIAGGKVFFGSYDHYFYAVDAKTGALRWQYDAIFEVVSSPLVVDGIVYVGGRSSDLFAFDAESGKVKWRSFYWSSWVESSAVLYGGTLYIGSSDYQKLFAIDPATGKKIWTFNTDGSSWSTPAVNKETVFIGATGMPGYFIENHGAFFAVNRESGTAAWYFPMPAPESGVYGVASSPAVDQARVYFGGLDGTFYAFSIHG